MIGGIEMIAKDNVTIGIEWRFGLKWPGQRCGAKHVKARLANVQQTDETAVAGCTGVSQQVQKLQQVVQRLQQQTQLLVSTPRQ